MKFKYHITNMVKKALNVSNWILRTFITRETYPMLTLLKTVLLPHLEYASVVWSPNESGLIALIENVQKHFTSRFKEFTEYDAELGMKVCKVNYWQRLKKLKIYSLERRRERYQILFLYKILIGKYPNPGFDSDFINLCSRNGVRVKSKINLKTKHWVRSIRGASFFNKAPKLFNILPKELRHPKYINKPTPKLEDEFKENLDNYLTTVPDEPLTQGLKRTIYSNSILYQHKKRKV